MNKPLLSTSFLYHPLFQINPNKIYPDQIIQRSGIKILTYNFFLRPPPIKNNKDDYKDERVQDFKDKFKDFDIICFQEMFDSFHIRKQQMIQYAAESGLFYHCESSLPSFLSKYLVDGGLLIVSRFPIVETQFEEFPYGLFGDSIFGKGILYAKIKVNDSIIALFTTHFQSSSFKMSDSRWNFTISTRTEQSEYVINFIYEKICSWTSIDRQKTKIILVGDLNIDYYDYEELRKV